MSFHLVQSPNLLLVSGTLFLAWFLKRCLAAWMVWRSAGQHGGLYFRPFHQDLLLEVLVPLRPKFRPLAMTNTYLWESKYSNGALAFFGPNLATTDGETWSRHRKFLSLSLWEASIRYIWKQTVRIVNEMFDADPWTGEITKIEHVPEMTKEIALLIIGAVAFGQETSWEATSTVPIGHQMKFQEAVRIVSRELLFRVGTPS
ncbi:hypothetical protein M407DRAFT_4659 [Tulasnella calospora MUT 4182]|uniref:Cytochrome P450 n=1 Tax=Tulasnella calospora MUT 4182 TaxID=1051891 RepID=A0A0C3MEZ9_9AGAM|nr:hypothetical protein M407DRAFT_4659 [Tulasnella calospora MUT 4182]